MAGLVPAIHAFVAQKYDVDARDNPPQSFMTIAPPGHDGF
jgi:hypothetical protein